LSLTLVADIVEREGIVPNPGISLLISSAAIQTQLISRILDHVHDEDLRRLAAAAVVLRRVTPDVIRDVLMEPVGVRGEAPGRVQQILDQMARESSLFARGDDGALYVRADVRSAMARAL